MDRERLFESILGHVLWLVLEPQIAYLFSSVCCLVLLTVLTCKGLYYVSSFIHESLVNVYLSDESHLSCHKSAIYTEYLKFHNAYITGCYPDG